MSVTLLTAYGLPWELLRICIDICIFMILLVTLNFLLSFISYSKNILLFTWQTILKGILWGNYPLKYAASYQTSKSYFLLLHSADREFHIYKTFRTSGSFRVNKLDDCHIKFDGNKHRILPPDHTKSPTTQNSMENLCTTEKGFWKTSVLQFCHELWQTRRVREHSCIYFDHFPSTSVWFGGSPYKHILSPTRCW